MFEASIPGFTVTEDREQAIDFLPAVSHSEFGISLRRPLSNDISMSNYIDEFKLASWILLLGMFLVSWMAILWLLFHKRAGGFQWLSSLSEGTSFILRSFLNKVRIHLTVTE